MRKTKNFNIQVPELGDVPDITQVSNAIQDLEDALAGTLEIVDASIQGSGLTLRSVARETKRTKYYEGMSVRFLCPQTITANTLKTVVVDDLPQQVITVPFDIIAGEYIDITYRGTSFTAHPVMIQKSESIDSNSNETVATSRAVKKVNDKVNTVSNEVNELDKNKENAFEKKSGFNLDKTDSYVESNSNKLFTQKGANDLKREIDGKEPAFSKKSGFNLDKTDNVTNDTNKLFTAKGAYNLKNEVDTRVNTVSNKVSELDKNKVSKAGDTMTGGLTFKNIDVSIKNSIETTESHGGWAYDSTTWNVNGTNVFKQGVHGRDKSADYFYLGEDYGNNMLRLYLDGKVELRANNLKTKSKEVISAINELHDGKENAFSKKTGFNLDKSDSVTSTSTTTLATSKAVKTLNDAKFDKSGGTVSGNITVTGTVYCNGNITAFSDIRLKENLNIIENPLEKVLKVNGYTYNMIGHKERMTGVIAQELEQVLPEAVNETDEGIKSVAYGNVIGLLIEAIKEQNKEIEKLKALVM